MVSRVLVGVPAVMPGLPLVLVAVLVGEFVVVPLLRLVVLPVLLLVVVAVLRLVLVPVLWLLPVAAFMMLPVAGPLEALPRVGQFPPHVNQAQAVAGQPAACVPRGGRAERL